MKSVELKRALRKHAHHEETDSEGSWAISYGDMITLLLTFFILFFNVNDKKTAEKAELQKAILAEFGIEKEKAKLDEGKDPAKMKMADTKEGELEEKTMKEWGGIIHRDGNKIIVEFPNTTFFNSGKTDVLTNSAHILNAFAKKYTKFAGTNSLSVKAYTDTRKVVGNYRFKDNLELSALRSISAMRILQKAGLPLDKMRIAGHGEISIERAPSSIKALYKNGQSPSISDLEKEPVERGNALARKVILVIEPLTKEKL